MIEPVEIEHSRYQVARAEARLAYQREVVRTLRFDRDPRSDAIANETLRQVEDRLAALRLDHLKLLATNAALMAATVDGTQPPGLHLRRS